MYRHWVFNLQRDSYDTRCKNDHHNSFAFYNEEMLVVCSTVTKMFGRVFDLSLAVGRVFDRY